MSAFDEQFEFDSLDAHGGIVLVAKESVTLNDGDTIVVRSRSGMVLGVATVKLPDIPIPSGMNTVNFRKNTDTQ